MSMRKEPATTTAHNRASLHSRAVDLRVWTSLVFPPKFGPLTQLPQGPPREGAKHPLVLRGALPERQAQLHMHDGQHEEVDARHQQEQGPMLGAADQIEPRENASRARPAAAGPSAFFRLISTGKTASCTKRAKAKRIKNEMHGRRGQSWCKRRGRGKVFGHVHRKARTAPSANPPGFGFVLQNNGIVASSTPTCANPPRLWRSEVTSIPWGQPPCSTWDFKSRRSLRARPLWVVHLVDGGVVLLEQRKHAGRFTGDEVGGVHAWAEVGAPKDGACSAA